MAIGILLAAGSGSRMESHNIPKGFIEVDGQPLFMYSLHTFLSVEEIQKIILVVPNEKIELLKKTYKNDKVIIIEGGKTRQESVFLALTYLKPWVDDDEIIVIHDSARPLVSKKIIYDNIDTCKKHHACLTAIKAIDTIVHTNDCVCVDDIPIRSVTYQEQTPSSFKFDIIYNAHQNAIKYNILDASDDCQLVLNNQQKLYLVSGDRDNFKITNEIDLALFITILKNRSLKL